MTDQWQKPTELSDKLKQFSEALNQVMLVILEHEKKKIDNVKKVLDIKKKNG